MTTTYFKAVRPDGHDFHTGLVDYLAEGIIRHPDVTAGQGLVEPAPGSRPRETADAYLSVSTVPTDCTGFSWPARLLEVEAVGPVWTPHASNLPNKRAVLALRVVAELDPLLLFGNHGAEVQAIVERSKRLTYDEVRGMAATWHAIMAATGAAARDAARAATWHAIMAATGAAMRDAARDATWHAIAAATGAATGDAAWAATWDATWDATRHPTAAATGAAARAATGAVTRDLIGTAGYTQEMYDLLTGPWRRVIGPIFADDKDLRA